MMGLLAILLSANTLLLLVEVITLNEYTKCTENRIEWLYKRIEEKAKEENKTYKKRLKEKFPNAVYGNDNLPEVCAGQLFGFNCREGDSCIECWNRTEKERRVQNANS